MTRPIFREERCKGCGLCIVVCPKKIIEIGPHFNSRGYHPAVCIDEKLCIGCTLITLLRNLAIVELLTW